jgi:hypothetical protein
MFRDQPDYAAKAEEWVPPFLPTMIRDMWIEGNHRERFAVDRMLDRQRRSMERDMKTMFKFD